MQKLSLDEEFRARIHEVDRQAEEEITKPFNPKIRGCHDSNPHEPHTPTIRSHIAEIRDHAEKRKGEIAVEFIEAHSIQELESTNSYWDVITGWRYARFGTVQHRCLKAVQQAVRKRFPEHRELQTKLKSHSSEPWMKKLRLVRSRARSRKGPSPWNPARQDARDAAVSYFVAFHPLCKILKRAAKSYSRSARYHELRAWMLEGEIPPALKAVLPERVRMSLLFIEEEYSRAVGEMKLAAFFQLLRRRLSRQDLEEFANKIYGPSSQLSPSRMAEILASHFAGIAVNEVQSARRGARESARDPSKP